MRKIGYKVLLEVSGDSPGDVSGDRLCRLLQVIDQAGSISRAAAELKMSYRYAWGLVKAAEERLSCTLLTKRVGGAAGGGAALTAAAHHLVEQYWVFRANIDARADQVFAPAEGAPVAAAARHPLLMATTIGPVEAGLLPALAAAFLEETGIPVRHIAAGSGQALQIAREGRADIALTHAPELEAAFLAEGFGVQRHPLMYNDLILMGPAADPAGAGEAGSARDAFQRCAAVAAPFVTRGDLSGTHVHEMALWEAAGVRPTGPWYQVCNRGALGSLATLRSAEQLQAYVLVDRATYLAARTEGTGLALLFAGDAELRNVFSLILVSPERFPLLQHESARRFVAWATGAQAQALIAEFGVRQFGEPIFQPADLSARP